MIDLKQIKIPKGVFKTMQEDYEIEELSDIEFSEILQSSLWELFIQNSLEGNSKQSLENDFLTKNYINKNFENKLIKIYQDISKKIENKDYTDYKVSKNINIKGENQEKAVKQISSIILANNISYLKSITSKIIKPSIDYDKYLEALDLGVGELTKRLLTFDTSKGFNIKTYVELYLKQEIKKIYDNPFKEYPKEYYKIHKFLKDFGETKQEYTYFGNYELLLVLIGDIQNLDREIIKKFGKLYFYILGFGEVTIKHFCTTYGIKEDIDSPPFFRNDNNVDIFINEILNYLKEYKDNNTNNKGESYLLKKLREVSDGLNLLDDGGFVSLDTKIGEDNDTTLLETIGSDNGMTQLETEIYQKDNLSIWDREIRHIQIKNGKREEIKPNIDWNYLERIIAGTCINEYFTFKEFRNMLLKYGEEKGVGEKYKDNFHTYLSLFKFKDKSNWYQYDNRVLDALTFEQMGDILGFSKQYAIKVYQKLKEKFDNFYGPHIVFTKYDTGYHGPTKTFRDLKKKEKTEEEITQEEKLENLKQEYVPEENFKDSYQAKKL